MKRIVSLILALCLFVPILAFGQVPATIKFRRDTSANWTAANPVLGQGEPGFEYDTYRLKIGDGMTSWTLLPYYGNVYGYSTSTVSMATTGSKTFQLPVGLSFAANMPVIATYTGGAGIYLVGTVTSYSPTTGIMVLNDTLNTGSSSSYSTWVVWVSSGPQGPAGPVNSLSIGYVGNVASGGNATASITGTPPSQVLNLGLPIGATGATGPALTAPRQTVLSGPVDSNGNSAFGGSAGSTTVTMSGTLVATAANGFTTSYQQDVTGTGTSLSWTGLSSNGTMYLYVTISGGTLTTASTTLQPIYEWGGTPSTTNGQLTFNIQQMVGYLGNGSTAPQTAWVAVGEVQVSGSVVSQITWYALMGRYTSAWTATLPAPGTTTTTNHNLGIQPMFRKVEFLCTTNDSNIGAYAGDIIDLQPGGSSIMYSFALPATRNTIAFTAGAQNTGYYGQILSSGDKSDIYSISNFSYRFIANRGW